MTIAHKLPNLGTTTKYRNVLCRVWNLPLPSKKKSQRQLHQVLGVNTEYKKWFKRMTEYGFTEGEDFSSFIFEQKWRGQDREFKGRPNSRHPWKPLSVGICRNVRPMLENTRIWSIFWSVVIKKAEKSWYKTPRWGSNLRLHYKTPLKRPYIDFRPWVVWFTLETI